MHFFSVACKVRYAGKILLGFPQRKPVVGMVHVPALPGSPAHSLGWEAIRAAVLRDAETLAGGGVDGLLIENYGDTPFYPRRVPPHTIAFLAVLAAEIRARWPVPLGVNVLRNDARAALAVAAAAGAQFVRVNVLAGARLADQGIVEGEAHAVMRYRRLLGAPVLVFADVAVKHSAPLAERSLADETEDLIGRAGADALIVTGTATGKQTPLAELQAVKRAAGAVPVFAGSGADAGNVARVLAVADGVIAGTALKRGGVTANPVDPARVAAFMRAARRARDARPAPARSRPSPRGRSTVP